MLKFNAYFVKFKTEFCKYPPIWSSKLKKIKKKINP